MKNLTVRKRDSRALPFLQHEINTLGDSVILHTVNTNNDDFYMLLNSKLYKIPSDFQEHISSFEIDHGLELISLEYCSITQDLYGACISGDIVKMNLESTFTCESMIRLKVDLQCMTLSPDHEIIILITTAGVAIVMTYTFQIISEVDLYEQSFGQKQFVTVGWGKKETQFHGSEGKKAATVKPIELNRNDLDDGSCRITWREDGSLFAIGFLHPQETVRQFKIFNREGILQYTSEVANGLEEPLSWKPSGSLIATTQVIQKKHVVAFFEKNGLKHREFTLPLQEKKIKVKDLFWSLDSEVLTIWCEIHGGTSLLQLWTENNCHWYLKQSIEFPVDNSLLRATWGFATCSKILILLTQRELITYIYDWSINHSKGNNVQNKSIVGVIDGDQFLMTAFRDGIVPPPMAHQITQTIEPINAIVFAPPVENENSWPNSNSFFCVTSSGRLVFYKYVLDPLEKFRIMGACDLNWNMQIGRKNSFYDVHHFLWLDEDHILCSLSISNQSFLCVLILGELGPLNGPEVTVKQTHLMDGLIQHIIPSPEMKEAYIVVGNSIMKYTKEHEVIPTDIQLQNYVHKVEAVSIGIKHVILSLHHRNCFATNGRQIANNITSFFVHSDFLLLTTAQHTLICVKLNEEDLEALSKQDLAVKPWENDLNENLSTNLNIRRIERGSKIIVAVPKESKVILQMPRGNLECLQPRPLSLSIIGFYLDDCRYLDAFDLMRKQRVNLNLMFDYNSERFVGNAHKFVDQISNASWLSLFISELTEEDVTRTIYANYYRRHETKLNTVVLNKIESVCKLLRDIMEERNNANRLIQPILISLVKDKRTQGMEAALTKIKELRKLDEGSTEDKERITSDEALKYLLYIVDVNVLFDTALGMYDFDLTMFIASKSHKDPKEYIPFLNSLMKLDENYMKYSIDLHLKRYDSALEHIAKEPSMHEKCINLIRNHDLYTKALKLFERNSEEYKVVVKMYGEFLMKKQHYQEAGIMFCRSLNFSDALNAYKIANSWQDVITVSTQMDLSETERQGLYKDLVKRLKNDKKYEEAAYVLISYVKHPEEAIVCLCNGKRWKDAVRIACDTKNADLIELQIRSSVYEYADHVMSQMEKNKEDFEQHKSRLVVVRKNISQKNINLCNAMYCDTDLSCNKDISDILSDTTSIAGSTVSQRSKLSTLSGKSYRSSKNRRKQERKLLSLKEGSVFEDLALIQALYQIVNNTYKEQDDLHLLIQMLVYFGDDEYAEKVQNRMEQFLSVIERSKSVIWNKTAPSSLSEMEAAEISSSTDLQGFSACHKLVEPYITRPPIANTSSWKLNIF